MKRKFFGYTKVFSSKKNQWFMFAHCLSKPTDYDRSKGYVGSYKVEEVFIPESLWKLVEEKCSSFEGKELVFDYQLDGRFQSLVDIRLV